MEAAGFRDAEAHILMPMIGWMDIGLGLLTLLHPTQLTTAWMTVWAFSTALVRPVSAGLKRSMDVMNDNALWGFVERAANWATPLALLHVQSQQGYQPSEIITGLGNQLGVLDAYLSGFPLPRLYTLMACGFLMVWLPVPLLRSRSDGAKTE